MCSKFSMWKQPSSVLLKMAVNHNSEWTCQVNSRMNFCFKFIQSKGVVSSSAAYHAIMDILLSQHKQNQNNIKEIEILLNNMRRQGCAISIDLAGRLISLFGRANMVHKSVQIFHEVTKTYPILNAYPYHCLLDVFVKSGHIDEALSLLHEMVKAKCMPNNTALSQLFAALSIQNRLLEGRRFALHMTEKGSVKQFTQFIHALCELGETDMAWDLVHIAKCKGTCLAIASFHVLLNSLGHDGLIEEAQGLFDKMRHADCDPDTITYNILIHGLCKVGRVHKACGLAAKMMQDGYFLSIVTYNTLINGLCKLSPVSKSCGT